MLKIYNKKDLTKFFEEKIKIPSCEYITESYILGVFVKNVNNFNDIEEVTITYNKAVGSCDFTLLNNIGDILLFKFSLFPGSFKNASLNFYEYIARSSYHTCYKILNKKLYLYEELADKFNTITSELNQNLGSSIIEKNF